MEVLQESKDTSITIQVDQNQDRQITDGGGSGGSIFSPTDQADADHNSEESNPIDRAPEKRLTLFALRLAVLEKAASGLGTLGFVWATVVLLGGFAITLDKMDFWVITVILVIEGARIFSRSHELEWQHQSTRSSSIYSHRHSLRELESTCNELRTSYSNVHGMAAAKVRRRETQPCSHADDNHHNLVQCRWKSTEVPLLPYTGWFSLSSNISRVLYWLQLLSAIACVTLSLIRLIKQDYGEVSKGDSDKRNRKAALNIFYSLALAEALLFLSEKAYWEWKVRVCNLLNQVNDACGFHQTDIVPIKRFFYDAFSKCINGSIFDGLKMDMVSFSEELLGSDSYDEQLIGARILLKFATKKEFAIETLRKIGTSSMTMERLLEMLNWKNPIEEELRMAAAMVVLRLSGKKQNTLRLAGIPGSLESISSLLNSKPRANSHRNGVVPHQQGIDFPAFNLIGLRILKKLVHDHDNCSKIGNTRGLLQKIIDFTGDAKRLLRENRESSTETQIEIDTMKYALQVVKMLASTSGPTGKVLRQEISEIVFTIINIRDILKYGENHMMLQQVAIEILRSLAMDEEARDKLGCTGGIVRELFVIFFKDTLTDKQNSLRAEAGEALMMITLDNMENCKRILNQGFVDSLIQAINLQPSLMKNSARILRNMCAYIGAENLHHLRGIIAATPTVLKSVMEEEGITLEASIGLAVQMFRFLSLEEFMNAGIEERDLAKKLIDILRKHSEPSYNLPRIRRFTIELAISMMKLNKMNIRFFKEEELKEELMNVADTTSELELFLVFSGSAGLSRHHTTMYTLVEDALKIMENSSRCEQGCISSRKK